MLSRVRFSFKREKIMLGKKWIDRLALIVVDCLTVLNMFTL
jgi:hypothetical protein